MSISDRLEDEKSADALRSGRTPHPDGPIIRWDKGKVLEIEALPVDDGQSADRALLEFLGRAMGDDAGLVDALDLDRMSVSLLFDADGDRQLAWIKCPVDRTKLRPPRIRALAQEFVEEVSTRRSRVAPEPVTGETVDKVWAVSDLQLGKGVEAFGGLAATQKRINWLLTERLPATCRKSANHGSSVRRIHIATLGDLTEGCEGSYDQQPYKIVLNSAEQFRAALGILDRMIERALDIADVVDVSAVASNHDQNARGSRRRNITDHWDDRSFMLMDALSLAYSSHSERYRDRVRFLVPEDPLVGGFKIRDTNVCTTHGHVADNGSLPGMVKMSRWWGDQIKSRRGAAAAASVCIAAHYHHHYILRDGGRLLIGTPALDGGSGYLHDAKGTWSAPGFVDVTVDDVGVRGTELHTWPQDRVRAKELGVSIP